MPTNFYWIITAQFFSAIADNAALFIGINLIEKVSQTNWHIVLPKLALIGSYVLLAPIVGLLADRYPKSLVMFFANSLKLVSCLLLLMPVPPMLTFLFIGIGAAIYAPAKFGIVTELLPGSMLVKANGWIESATVGSVLIGTVLGGYLCSNFLDDEFYIGVLILVIFYLIAALLNLQIKRTSSVYHNLSPWKLAIEDFFQANRVLWKDKIARVALLTTTMFWGIAASLQILTVAWARDSLHLDLGQTAYLQGLSAAGIILGAVMASRWIRMEQVFRLFPVGLAIGFFVLCFQFVHAWWVAAVLMIIVGAFSGFFLVPMNALLQHRGHVLLTAGRSIAVQNFNESFSVLVFLGLTSCMISFNYPYSVLFLILGMLILVCIALTIIRIARQKDVETELHH